MKQELIAIETLDPSKIFNDEEATKIINQITTVVKETPTDISTAKGRKELASLAAKISRSKTLIDDMGKDLVSGWKKKAKEVDAVRKTIRESLDELKEETRAPLTEWEENEKARIEAHEKAISDMKLRSEECRDQWMSLDISYIIGVHGSIEAVVPQSFEEFEHDATTAKVEALSLIETALEQRKKYDEEKAELEKLRAQAAEADRLNFEAKAKREAEEASRQEAFRAEEERKKAEERAKREVLEAQAETERVKKEAEAEAQRREQEAEERAFREIEEKQAREKAEAEAREANKKHCGAINRKALEAFVAGGLDKEVAKKAVELIAKNMIPNVKISY